MIIESMKAKWPDYTYGGGPSKLESRADIMISIALSGSMPGRLRLTVSKYACDYLISSEKDILVG